MPMSKKDYEAVAAAIKTVRREWDDEGEVHAAMSQLVSNLSGVFAADNQLFDRARFAKAAGGGL